jgi:mannose-6-phosphate isomerase
MGAHPSAPSGIQRHGRHATLDAVIADGARGELGADVAERFGSRLPFLLKVLAARKALSIQVHPSRAQAEAGFRSENERGLAPGDKSRNYVDDWPKPEILCALTNFEVLAGMRDRADAARLLRELGVPALAPLAAELGGAATPAAGPADPAEPTDPGRPHAPAPVGLPGGGGPDPRAGVLARILTWPAHGRQRLADDVAAACEAIAARQSGPYAAACAATARLAADHPGDLGIVASLLLRHAVLEPGQAVFMPAGGLHAYLHGTGIELLANSDNVVRAGLTGKHVDIPELLKLADPAVQVPLLAPGDLGDGISVYDTPAPEFRLYRACLRGADVTLPGRGPRVVLVVSGTLRLQDRAGAVKVGRGESCYVPASSGPVTATGIITGPAVAFIATVADAQPR